VENFCNRPKYIVPLGTTVTCMHLKYFADKYLFLEIILPRDENVRKIPVYLNKHNAQNMHAFIITMIITFTDML
jgi:hypothetical protein